MVLDAKNHFVRHVTQDFFEADERGRTTAHSYVNHPLRQSLERALAYCGLQPREHVEHFTSTVTPFVLDAGHVKALMTDVEAKSGRPFSDEFAQRQLTEFFLYSAWLVSQGHSLETTFRFDERACPAIWPGRASLAGVTLAVREADDHGLPVFTVHRRALGRLDMQSRRALAEFWTQRQLFDSLEQAEEFIVSFQRSFKREKVLRAVRGLVARARATGG